MPRKYIVGEEHVAGGTKMNFFQSPTPPVTQLLKNGQTDEWISVCPGGMLLVDHDDNVEKWLPDSYTGYPSTGWGDEGGDMMNAFMPKFRAVSYGAKVGSASGFMYDDEGNVFPPTPASVLDIGYTSFIMMDEIDLGDQVFFIKSPDYLMYLLSGCPNYSPDHTPQEMQGKCPRRKIKKGQFKFTVLGVMSGTDINSLNTGYPPAGNPLNNAHSEKDIANYKTLIYRTVLDVGAMASETGDPSEVTAYLKSIHTNSTKLLSEVTSTEDIADHVIHVGGPKHGDVTIELSPYYSTGKFTRNLADGVCGPGDSLDDFQACTRDVTGFDNAPDSFPANMNKHVGAKLGDRSMSKDDIRSLGGAPKLDVSEVKSMKITIKPASCSGRPASPPWDSAPDDCPWWYVAECNHDGYKWCVDEEEIPHLGIMGKKDDQIKCESGLCYHIDFHIDLGGRTEESRTLFGNPENDASMGLERGTFFIYDPTVSANGEVEWWRENLVTLIFAGLTFLVLLLITCCVCCIRRCRRKKDPNKTLSSGSSGNEYL